MEAAVGCLHGQGTKFFEVLSKEANLKQEQEEQGLSHFECIKLAVDRVCSMV